MSIIFDSKDAVLFVGGRGAKTGDQYAGGGCTKEFWGDLKNPSKTLADVMDSQGLSLSDFLAGLGDIACDVVNNGSGKVRITKAGQGYFTNCCAGLIARVDFAANYTDGRYEVIDVDGTNGDWIDIDETYSADTTCGTQVGGAFPNLQIASDKTDANSTTPHNVYILTNKNETFTAANSIDIDAGGGDPASNTWKRIIGVDDDGVMLADGEWVIIDGADYACDIFDVDGVSNISFHHVHAHDAGTAKAGFNFGVVSGNFNFLLEECKVEESPYGVVVQGYNVRNFVIVGGEYYATIIPIYIKGTLPMARIQGVYAYSSGTNIIYLGNYGGILDGCILEGDGGCFGVKAVGTVNVVKVSNCVIYNVIDGINLDAGPPSLTENNNIFVVAAKATGKSIRRTVGSIVYSDYSCLWALDGSPSASGRWGGDGKPEHAIEEDPDLVDAANGNFRPRKPNVLRGGKPDIAGNTTEMGAVLQEYEFARRAKAANLGRLQIIR